ncbi:ABC transporter permease [Ectobacillus sp. sgz5001026]|uniref:ABC transporter permease n=1 Tax=Ectobacillus sp. sgz5001026 TaxID=3242473 RepID=UPI0036D25574
MNAMMMQCKVEVMRTFRNRRFIFASLVMPILFYYLFTNMVTGGNADATWKEHYLVSMAAFSVIGTAINTLGLRLVQENSQGWSRLMRITPLPNGVYVAAKMIAQSLVNALCIIVVFVAGFLINHIQLSMWQWVSSFFWILIGAMPFLALGTVIGTMKKIDTASAVANILYLSISMLGGLWIPLEIFPTTLQTIGKILPTYSFGNGAWNIVDGKAPDLGNAALLAGYLVVFVVLSIYIRKRQEAV